VGIVCTLIPAIVGVAVGSVADFYGCKIDTLLMRIVDIQVAFPFSVLLIAILAILGPGTINIYYALILVGWIAFARLIPGEVLVAKHLEYVTAARTMGCSNARIIIRHLLPNIIGPTLDFGMSAVVLNILSGASLGFLGLGMQPPQPGVGGADLATTYPAHICCSLGEPVLARIPA
jgi:peptide/nickel transport system permease protein